MHASGSYNFFRSDASLGLKERLSASLSEIARDGATTAFHHSQYSLFKRLVGPTLQKVAPHVHAAVEANVVATSVDEKFRR